MPARDSSSEGVGSKQPIPAVLENAAHSSSALAAAQDPGVNGVNEDQALALLGQPDLPSEMVERISKSRAASGRKVKLAIVGHPRTPRYVAMTMVRQLFTFDLMRVALTPVVAADIKVAAEEALLKRLESISWGERLSLARRASGRIAAALLVDPEPRVMRVALENPRLTEVMVQHGLAGAQSTAALVRAVAEHPKWSLRREIRIHLLRNEKTPVDRAMEFARNLPPNQLKEILRTSHLPAIVKSSILSEVRTRARN